MKGLLIASNRSGGGKTTITLGIMKALMKRGFEIQGYKVGPDYIDPAFHSHITKKPSRNLDIFLMGEDGVKASYSRGTGDLSVIEGVMGFYDGKGIDTLGSAWHVSNLLDVPVVLVISPKAQSTTLCAEINGILSYRKNNIKAVILNNIKEGYYKLLKYAIEQHCGVRVLGYVPEDSRLQLKSRHLGLVQSSEIEDLDSKIDICAELLENHVDINALIQLFKERQRFEDCFHVENKRLTIAVAMDKAFSFYYKENMELLQELGEIKYFSPLEDKTLPKNVDLIYIGGGYPEIFIEELSKNKTMLKSIKQALDTGVKCFAECGGLMYLTEGIEGYETVGFFKGHSEMTKTLQNFGYASIEVTGENKMLPEGFKINCHEFHKSKITGCENNIYTLTKSMYDGSEKRWHCGYSKNNTIAAYGHIHFFSNLKLLEYLTAEREE